MWAAAGAVVIVVHFQGSSSSWRCSFAISANRRVHDVPARKVKKNTKKNWVYIRLVKKQDAG
jgi:hypothetical protein